MNKLKKNEENKDVSRRDFLTKGVVFGATGASIIAIASSESPSVRAAENATQPVLSNDQVFTESIRL